MHPELGYQARLAAHSFAMGSGFCVCWQFLHFQVFHQAFHQFLHRISQHVHQAVEQWQQEFFRFLYLHQARLHGHFRDNTSDQRAYTLSEF